MAKKKHCSNHYRYVATCKDCQAANVENSEDESSRRLYTDADFDEDESPSEVPKSKKNTEPRKSGPEIPNMDGFTPLGDSPRRPKRYRYEREPNPNRRKAIIITSIIIAVIVLLIGVYGIPSWLAGISLRQQLYETKSNLDYWKIHTLNYWSTSFIFNKIGLIGALIGSLLMTLPPEKTLSSIIKLRMGRGSVKTGRVILFWWTAGFALFYLIGQSIENGMFALTMYMIENGSTQLTLANFFGAFKILGDPGAVSIFDMYVYNAILLPLINYVLGILIFRIIISIVNQAYLKRDLNKSISRGFYLIGIFFIMGLFGRINSTLNQINLITNYSIWLGIFIFMGLGIGFNLYAKKMGPVGFSLDFAKNSPQKLGISAAAIIVIMLIPVFVTIPQRISLNQIESWKEIEFDPNINTQIEWTRMAAGIDLYTVNPINFERRDITDYTQSHASADDLDIVDNIRQYDKVITGKQISNIIGSPTESMADSDIIYVKNEGEYWVAPKTTNVEILIDNTALHTEKYDHVNGFVAIDTTTGDQLSSSELSDIFGVPADYKIFFGEREDTSYKDDASDDLFGSGTSGIVAFENDILLNTNWGSGAYEGAPDGTLSGLQSFWFTMRMGLTTYALESGEKDFLINRNIKQRVEDILMPGLEIDGDPYLIFNKDEGTVYYGLAIYTQITIGSYAQSPLYRFLGTVLVDVQTGGLSWYQNPNLPVPAADPLSPLWQIYIDIYNWEAVPTWLEDQMRYPESLWESQIAIDYMYHVTDYRTWNNANDFYKRPDVVEGSSTEGSYVPDTFFIETDLGEGLEFVGVDLVEYVGKDTQILAGLYVIRHGEHFGETIFYQIPQGETLIGPVTAKSYLDAQETEKIKLINEYRFGNVLLYPLAGSLYYYIPIYSNSLQDVEAFALAGLVNAFDKTTYSGQSASEAYTALALDKLNETTTPTEAEDLLMDISGPNEVVYNDTIWPEFRILLEYVNTSAITTYNLTLNLTVRADDYLNVSLFNTEIQGYEANITTGITGYNYTITDIVDFYPGQGSILTIKINPAVAFSNPALVVGYKFDLLDGDSVILSSDWKSLTYQNPI